MPVDVAWARLYFNVSLIECDSKEILDEILATTGLGAQVVHRVSDRCVVVDSHQKAAVQRALARRGYPSRVVDLTPRSPAAVDDEGAPA